MMGTTSELLYKGLCARLYSVCRLSVHVVLNLHFCMYVRSYTQSVYRLLSVLLCLQVLESFSIMDYSLLLAVHYMQEGRGGDLVRGGGGGDRA